MINEDERITPSNSLQRDTHSYSDEKVIEGSPEWSKTGRSSYRNPVGTFWPGMMTFLPAEWWGQCPRKCESLLFHSSPILVPVPTGTWDWVMTYLSLAIPEGPESSRQPMAATVLNPVPILSLISQDNGLKGTTASLSLFQDVKTRPRVQWSPTGGAEWQKLNDVLLSPSWSLGEESTGTEMTSPRHFRQTIAKPRTKNCSCEIELKILLLLWLRLTYYLVK